MHISVTIDIPGRRVVTLTARNKEYYSCHSIHMVIYFAELHSQTHYIDILLQTSMLLP